MFLTPFELNPQLTDERIDTVGRLIATAHNQVLERADERDTGWSIGCRSHVWRSTTIIQAVEARNYPWLKIESPGLRFVFSIGGVPVSMYRGSHEHPRKNILNRAESFPELLQLPLLEEVDGQPELVWSFALETAPNGEVLKLEFIGITPAGETLAYRHVPLDEPVTRSYKIEPEQAELIDLPPARVSLIQDKPARKRANKK